MLRTGDIPTLRVLISLRMYPLDGLLISRKASCQDCRQLACLLLRGLLHLGGLVRRGTLYRTLFALRTMDRVKQVVLSRKTYPVPIKKLQRLAQAYQAYNGFADRLD